MSHFELEVDPAGVAVAASALAAFEGEVQAAADGLTGVLPEVQASWTGEAATALTAESEALRTHAAAATAHFAAAGAAMARFAEAAATAVDVDVPRLNMAWDDAQETRDRDVAARRQQEQERASALFGLDLVPAQGALGPYAAPRAALPPVTAPSVAASDAALARTRRRLEREFDDLREDLRAEARRAGGELAAATVVPVTREQAQRYAAGGIFGGLFGAFGAGPGVFALQSTLPLTALQLAQTLDLPTDSTSLGGMLDDARALGLPPLDYANVLEAYWQARAYEAAGIDPAEWDPSRGVDHNRETILAVYDYYGRLYRANPGMEWAGLANLVGPGFAASFFDLGMARDVAGALARLPDLPSRLTDPMQALAGASDEQLQFFEQTFLTMQKDIFRDMGGMHEAYLDGPGGLERIQELYDAKIIDEQTMVAWRNIDTGVATDDPTLLHEGARGLAYREQFTVIGDDWDAMRDHPPMGEAITYVFTAVGKPSIPGARFPGDVSPLIVPVTPARIPVLDPSDLPFVPGLPFVDVPDHIELPAQVKVRTSLPDFNVADRDSRWAYFTADTLPRYIDLLEQDGVVRDLTAGDLAQRIAQERTLHRLPEVLAEHDPRDWRPVVE